MTETNKKDPKIKSPGILKLFQMFLKQMTTLNNHCIEKETNRIKEGSKCSEWFDDLVKAVIKSNIVLLTFNTSKKHKSHLVEEKYHEKTDTRDFVHKCYIECARSFYNNPEIFWDGYTAIEIKRNQREIYDIVQKSIQEAIRKMLPVKLILSEYLANDYVDEPYNDITNYVSESQYTNVKNLVNKDLHGVSEGSHDVHNTESESVSNSESGSSMNSEIYSDKNILDDDDSDKDIFEEYKKQINGDDDDSSIDLEEKLMNIGNRARSNTEEQASEQVKEQAKEQVNEQVVNAPNQHVVHNPPRPAHPERDIRETHNKSTHIPEVPVQQIQPVHQTQQMQQMQPVHQIPQVHQMQPVQQVHQMQPVQQVQVNQTNAQLGGQQNNRSTIEEREKFFAQYMK